MHGAPYVLKLFSFPNTIKHFSLSIKLLLTICLDNYKISFHVFPLIEYYFTRLIKFFLRINNNFTIVTFSLVCHSVETAFHLFILITLSYPDNKFSPSLNAQKIYPAQIFPLKNKNFTLIKKKSCMFHCLCQHVLTA